MLTPKPTCWHFNQRKFLEGWVGSPSVFIQHHMFFRHFLAAIWHLFFPRTQCTLWLVPFRNEDKTETRVMGLGWQKPDLPIWWYTVSTKKVSRHKDQDLQSIRGMSRTRISLAMGNCGSSGSNAEVGSSQVIRQEMVKLASWKLGQGDFDPTKEWRGRYQHRATCSNITRDGERDILQLPIRWEGISLCTEETGKSSNKFYVRSGFLQEERIGMEIVHGIVDEGSHPPWAEFPR